MEPRILKKIQIADIRDEPINQTIYKVEENEEDDNEDDYSSDHENVQLRKQRKRRTLSETSKRDYICGCGRSYVSYPAIYLHVQRKHNGQWPENTVVPEKANEQDRVKRGRPKKEKTADADVEVDLLLEEKSIAEDNFWLFVGTKGNPNNPKIDNKFITSIEDKGYNPLKSFIPQELFENDIPYNEVLVCLRTIAESVKRSEEKTRLPGVCKSFDLQFSHFILWISTLLREEVFVEIAITLCLLRNAIVCSLWCENQENLINIKGDGMDIRTTPRNIFIKVRQDDIDKIESFSGTKVCPLMGPKWSDIRKNPLGKEMYRNMSLSEMDKVTERLFYQKLETLSKLENKTLDNMTEAVLHLKDTEIKDIVKAKRKFTFLNMSTRQDLKGLIHKLCDWLQYFDVNEYSLQDADLCLRE